MRVFRTFGQSRMHPKVCSDTDTSAAAAPDATPAASAIMSRIGLNMGTLLTLSAGSVGSRDRKSTRLNSSHGYISYAVFCLKKKKKNKLETYIRKTKDTIHSE